MTTKISMAVLLLWLACLLAQGCMRDYPAPVVERSIAIAKRKPLEPPAAYAVKPNDTLYSVAFRYGVDVEDLARWNGFQAPYIIRPGQVLHFSPAATVAVTPTMPAGGASANDIEIEPLPAPQESSLEPLTEPLAQAESSRDPQPEAHGPSLDTQQDPSDVQPTPPSGSESVKLPANPRWQWPTQGPLLSTFKAGDSTRNGVDIGGEPGQPVVAAAAGKVVYSGSGLIGYGELIIIKHNDKYLSAYGHNRKRWVSQGDTVRAGEQIAELGASGAPRPMLHFEIRKHGDPVDPLKFLPEL